MPDQTSIAIIHHKHAPIEHQKGYLLSYIAKLWEQQGIKVHHLFGTTDFVPANGAILHVDLSVVQKTYSIYTQQYSFAINAHVLDIRKRSFSEIKLDHPKEYPGSVIVKTNLNAGGGPERRIRRYIEPKMLFLTRKTFTRLARLIGWSSYRKKITSSYKYEIYPKASDVPLKIYHDQRLIVEKFLPERVGKWYCHRRYYFLGPAEVNQLWLSKKPICANDKDGLVCKTEVPPEELRNFRHYFKMDYGKIDYVLGTNGEVVVFDINKTPRGFCRSPLDKPWLDRLCQDLQWGIFHFLQPIESSCRPQEEFQDKLN